MNMIPHEKEYNKANKFFWKTNLVLSDIREGPLLYVLLTYYLYYIILLIVIAMITDIKIV